MATPDKYKRFTASPYYHTAANKNHADFIAGYGIWDDALKDWYIYDGFADEESAQKAADTINHAMWAVEDSVGLAWKDKPHGLATGDVKCEICDPIEDHD